MSQSHYRAVVCEALGPPDSLRLQRMRRRPLTPGTVRVALKAAGINFPDVLTIQGLYQHREELPFVPGIEAAGVVAEAAADVDGSIVGRKVIVRMRTGGYAEEAVIPLGQTLQLPEGFSFAEGASFLVAHMTAYHGLVTRAAIVPGQTLLVLGAAGGVGLAVVQLGKVLGARVVAAASTAEKLQVAARHGAEELIDYAAERLEAGVKRLTADRGVDVVFDPVGVAQASALRCLAHGGKLLVAGFAGGTIPAYAANSILLKGGSVIGVRAGEAGRQDPDLRKRELDALLSLATQGLVRPFVSARFPLQGHAEAMRMLQDRRAMGRIVLDIDAP